MSTHIPLIQYEWEDEDYENLHNEKIMTAVRSIHYDFKEKFLIVYMAPHTCCDMDGIVQFAKGIDKDVKQIQTYAGDEEDSCYIFREAGGWYVNSLQLIHGGNADT